MIKRHQITCAAEVDSLPRFRQLVDQACLEHEDIAYQMRYDLKLAIDEACTNIIQHGYAGMNPGSIQVDIEINPETIDVIITDFGHPFEPYEPTVPELDLGPSGKLGGFGLYFIYQAMDEVDYESSSAGNRLYLVKHIKT